MTKVGKDALTPVENEIVVVNPTCKGSYGEAARGIQYVCR